MNRDPIGYDGGMNLYEYAGDDPVNEIDTSGDANTGNMDPADPTQQGLDDQYMTGAENPEVHPGEHGSAERMCMIKTVAVGMATTAATAPLGALGAEGDAATEGAASDAGPSFLARAWNFVRGLFSRNAAPAADDAASAAGAARSSVQAAKAVGDAFRDDIAQRFRSAGYDVRTEVYKSTPFGKRYIDIQVSKGGKVLGGIECKTGRSPYTLYQRVCDSWLRRQGYIVTVCRPN